ncbi:MAG: pilus assembly protein PilM, partial [bacterium]|nr:pilus assembly protein PilM [bacterium]
RVAQMANLTLAGLEIESFSLTRSTLDPQDAAQPVLFLDIGSLSSSVAVFDDGFLRIVHNVGASSTDLMRACARALGTDIDRARAQYQAYGLYASGGDTEIVTAYLPLLEALSRDIERVFSAYWRSSTRQVSRVLLSGGAAVLKGLDHYLSSRLRVPVEIVNPLARLAMPKDLAPAASLIGPPLANAVGLAMKEI